MKTRVALIVLMLCGVCLTTAQNVIKKNKPHKVWVTSLDGVKHKGILYSANKDILEIARDNSPIIEIMAAEIHSIKIRRTNSPGRGAMYGALSGLIVGGAAGFIAGDDPDTTGDLGYPFGTYTIEGQQKEEKALIGGLVGTVVGAGFGTIFGAIKEKFIIYGNMVTYNSHLEYLRDRAINPDPL